MPSPSTNTCANTSSNTCTTYSSRHSGRCRFVVTACTALFGLLFVFSASAPANDTQTEVKVAFIGDQGVSQDARDVLQLIEDEGADLVLIQGDLGYDDGAAAIWKANMDDILGPDKPVLLVVGNHEDHEWPRYRKWLRDRIANTPDFRCEGDAGVKYYCNFRGLGIVFVSPGIVEVPGVKSEDNYAQYITDQFTEFPTIWRICSWHKNQQNMQVGGKGDATGWEVYQACLAQGGFVATGHEHSYSRTHLMGDFQNLHTLHYNDHLEVGAGRSFAFVSGLGGVPIREQQLSGDWWASVYTSTQNANYGALFCTFKDRTADCYFKDVAGLIPDQFTLESLNPGAASNDPASESEVTEEPDQAPENNPPTDPEPEAPSESEEQAATDQSADPTSDPATEEIPGENEVPTDEQVDEPPVDEDNPFATDPANTEDEDSNQAITDSAQPPTESESDNSTPTDSQTAAPEGESPTDPVADAASDSAADSAVPNADTPAPPPAPPEPSPAVDSEPSTGTADLPANDNVPTAVADDQNTVASTEVPAPQNESVGTAPVQAANSSEDGPIVTGSINALALISLALMGWLMGWLKRRSAVGARARIG